MLTFEDCHVGAFALGGPAFAGPCLDLWYRNAPPEPSGYWPWPLRRLHEPDPPARSVRELADVYPLGYLYHCHLTMIGAGLIAFYMHAPEGVTENEVRVCRWPDLHLPDGVWVIPAKLSSTRKTRRVPINDGMVKALESLKANCAWFADKAPIRSGYVFPGYDGLPITREALAALLSCVRP